MKFLKATRKKIFSKKQPPHRVRGQFLGMHFLADWKFTKGDEPDLEAMYPYNPPCGNTLMQIVTGGPMDKWNVMMQAYMAAIASARSHTYLQSPYFIPPEPIMKTLQNAALNGVDVRVMIPYRGDKGLLPPWASRSYIKDALDAGIRIYLYRKDYMHAKTMTIDDSLVTIGSTNIDFRGFEQTSVPAQSERVRRKDIFHRCCD